MKTIQYILLAVAMMFATTSFAQISSDSDSKAGYTCVLFEAGVSIGTNDFIEVSVAWERTNGQMIYTAARYLYTSITVGTELYFYNPSPLYDIARTQVSIKKYKNNVAQTGTGKWFPGFPAVAPFTSGWLWWAVGIVLPSVD